MHLLVTVNVILSTATPKGTLSGMSPRAKAPSGKAPTGPNMIQTALD